jgi:hypothetical protein
MQIKCIQIVLLLFSMVGFRAMSADIELTWEWPADRTVEQKLLVKIVDIQKGSPDFFNFIKTPSFANNLPDSITVKAMLIGQETDLKNKTIKLTLPTLELEPIKIDDFAIIGVVDNKICICIEHVESENTDTTKILCP